MFAVEISDEGRAPRMASLSVSDELLGVLRVGSEKLLHVAALGRGNLLGRVTGLWSGGVILLHTQF